MRFCLLQAILLPVEECMLPVDPVISALNHATKPIYSGAVHRLYRLGLQSTAHALQACEKQRMSIFWQSTHNPMIFCILNHLWGTLELP